MFEQLLSEIQKELTKAWEESNKDNESAGQYYWQGRLEALDAINKYALKIKDDLNENF